jgi:predicted Zn-dependent protease
MVEAVQHLTRVAAGMAGLETGVKMVRLVNAP